MLKTLQIKMYSRKYKTLLKKPAVLDTLIISALGKLSQDLCHEFEASLDHITNLCLKIDKDRADPVG